VHPVHPPWVRPCPALKNIKFLNFFIFLWVIFALPNSDPLT
jgi:hypothetical protein